MEKCYQCGEIEPNTWDLHVQGRDPGESKNHLVVRMNSCRSCVVHYLIKWGRSIQDGDIPVLSYDHDEHTAKMDAYRNR